MEVATTTTEAHLSAIHQSLLQISATLGRMLTYGCVNATSSPDTVVPAKCSTVGLNPNIGAVEVVDSSQKSGIVSTVNPGLVGAPPSSTMQRFGILKSGKHTPTTCSTGVLDVDTDAKNAKRDAGTLQAGLSVHVPWDPGVCNDAYSICQEKTGSHLQGVRGCVLYVWALANQLKELQLPLQCIPIEINQPCSLVIWSITISWDPGILQQIVRQASRPRKLDVQGVMFLHTIMLQQKLGDWCDPGMTFPMCSSFSGIGTTSTCLVFVQLTHMSAAVYSTTGNMLADPREAVQVQQELCKCYYLCSLIHMAKHLQYKQWDPGVTWIVGAEGIKLCSTQPRGTTDRISWLRRRFLCRSWSCSLLRPDLGIAWGQAMFLGGGIVTTTPRAWSLWALGQPCLAVMDASGVYRGEEVHRKGHEETEQNRPRSASLFPVPVRLVPSLVSLRSGGYHKPQYPSAHAAIPSPATGVTRRPPTRCSYARGDSTRARRRSTIQRTEEGYMQSGVSGSSGWKQSKGELSADSGSSSPRHSSPIEASRG